MSVGQVGLVEPLHRSGSSWVWAWRVGDDAAEEACTTFRRSLAPPPAVGAERHALPVCRHGHDRRNGWLPEHLISLLMERRVIVEAEQLRRIPTEATR